MRALILWINLLCLALFAGCRLSDERVTVIKTPGVRNENCAKIVSKALEPLRGIKSEELSFDYNAGTVTVRYDSMQLARKNIELAIAGAGFAANEIPADQKAQAALPPECKLP